jgi:hypothetical protein
MALDFVRSEAPRGDAGVSGAEAAPGLNRGAAFFGSALLGAAAGVQTMLAAILVAPRPYRPDIELTKLGARWFQPDRDMPLYLGGCALSVVLTLGFCWYWRAISDPLGPSHRDGYLRRAGRIQSRIAALIAVSGSAAILIALWLPGGRLFKVIALLLMTAPVAAGLAAALVALRKEDEVEDRHPRPATRRPEVLEAAPRSRFGLVGAIAAVCLVIGVLYVPAWRMVAGLAFYYDLFHHWDFFVTGPALGYLHGGALGTEVYAQYGLAWPLIFAWGRGIIGLDHATFIHVSIIYGCAYFLAYAFLLKWLLRDWSWAVAGTLIAINLSTQLGVDVGRPIWIWPSSTMLRSPMDLWFFLALLLHIQRGRPVWAFCAGLAVGLGLCFEIDTGIYLIGTLAVYLTSRGLLSRRVAGEPYLKGPATWPAIAGFLLAALPILTIASRGTIVQPAFWLGWTESIREYGGGMSALPIANLRGGVIIFFGLMTATYLFFFGRLIAAVVFGEAGRETILGGTLAAYGLATLLQFVNRSATYNLFHVIVPFSTLTIYVAARRLGRPPFAYLAVAVSLVALVINPGWRSYPSLAKWMVKRPATEGPRVSGAVLTIPENLGHGREYSQVTSTLRNLRDRGFSVGILDRMDATYYLGSGCKPGDRYAPLLAGMIWKRQFEGVKERFVGRRFDYVAMRYGGAAKGHLEDDGLSEIAQSLEPDYELESRCGTFGIWRRKDLGR